MMTYYGLIVLQTVLSKNQSNLVNTTHLILVHINQTVIVLIIGIRHKVDIMCNILDMCNGSMQLKDTQLKTYNSTI